MSVPPPSVPDPPFSGTVWCQFRHPLYPTLRSLAQSGVSSATLCTRPAVLWHSLVSVPPPSVPDPPFSGTVWCQFRHPLYPTRRSLAQSGVSSATLCTRPAVLWHSLVSVPPPSVPDPPFSGTVWSQFRHPLYPTRRSLAQSGLSSATLCSRPSVLWHSLVSVPPPSVPDPPFSGTVWCQFRHPLYPTLRSLTQSDPSFVLCEEEAHMITIATTITIYFINPSGKLKLSFDRTTNISHNCKS